MPELPEVETVRRGLEPFMAGLVLRDIATHRDGLRTPFPKNLSKNLSGRMISRLTRRAKYLLIHFEEKGREDILVIHLGMSGRMTVIQKDMPYTHQKHDHMTMTMEGGAKIVFNDPRRFGMVMLLKEADLLTHPSFKSLGPEPLPECFDGKLLQERLKGRKTPIKLALLDQRVVAGVGNIYDCEALYEAGIDPRRAASDISLARLSSLAAAIREVLRRSIEAGGSSLKDYRKADGKLGYFQHSFKVYGREGKACPKALASDKKKHIIQKITQGGRSTFYCPNCQT